jgi:hypothetical protein
VTANARLTGLAPGPAAPSPYGSTELREPSGPDLAKDGLSKPSLCWQTAISPYRTQEVRVRLAPFGKPLLIGVFPLG